MKIKSLFNIFILTEQCLDMGSFQHCKFNYLSIETIFMLMYEINKVNLETQQDSA